MMMMMTNRHQEHRQEQEEHAWEREFAPVRVKGQADHKQARLHLLEVEGVMMWAPLLLQDIIQEHHRQEQKQWQLIPDLIQLEHHLTQSPKPKNLKRHHSLHNKEASLAINHQILILDCRLE